MKNASSRIKLALIVSLLLACGSGVYVWQRPLPTVAMSQTVAPGERQVNLLAVGDWGDDTHSQVRVAEGMASFAEKRVPRLDGVLSLGDNFYVTLGGGVDDPNWDRLFERMFDPKRLNVPFYVLLGNHDYSGGREDRVELQYAQAKPNSRWKMPARWYRLELPSAEKPLVTFLMLDSNYLFLTPEQWREEADWLTAELAKPRTSRWLVLCAHHPLYTNGGHGDDARLRREWGPLLAEHQVDFYVAAHDHNLQYLRLPGIQTTFVVSGGGGATLHDIVRTDRESFSNKIHGFAHLRFGEESADLHLLDADGRPVHAAAVRPLRPDLPDMDTCPPVGRGPTTAPTPEQVRQ
jgi:tartrate-resistant acid phosphatase type 5